MAQSTSKTVIMTQDEINEFYDNEVKDEARKALKSDNPFWNGVEWFINWLRTFVKDFFKKHLSKLPIVGHWASRIASTISEFMFTVLGTMTHFLKVVLSSRQVWERAHESAMRTWSSNESNGLLAQTYAYGKKMAAYFLEIIKQCLERAIVAHGLQVSDTEKNDISTMLDDMMK